MKFQVRMIMMLGLAVAGMLAGTGATQAQTTPPASECADLLPAITMHRRTIEAARRTLSAAEAGCALTEVDGALGPQCTRVKQAANADPEKRRAWANAVSAWFYLDRLLLAVRAAEDRSGIKCEPR
jgi:hypothetical protein